MVNAFDLALALADGARDRHSAWAFIRGFAEHWDRPLRPGDGLAASELAALRDRVTATYPQVSRLPAAYLETHALLGHRRDLTNNQDLLLCDGQVHVDDTGQVLVVRSECQGCAEWGIRVADLGNDDPPVVMRVPGTTSGWVAYAQRWSLACLEIILFESLFGSSDLLWDAELDETAVKRLETTYQRLRILDLPHRTLPQVRWFTGPDLILRDEAETWLWARARTPQALDALRRRLER